MEFTLSVLADTPEKENRWKMELLACAPRESKITIQASHESSEPGQIVFIDAAATRLGELLASVDRRGRAVFLIVPEKAELPKALEQGQADDVLVYPFRQLELLGKLHQYQQILLWDEVARLNASFSDLLLRLRDDLRLAERLQKSKLPLRFPEVRGFRVTSRYLAGMRSGGDYFDLAESKDRSQLSIVLSDSSSYGLSSAVLSALMHVAVKLNLEQARSAAEVIRQIYDDLAVTLTEKDSLSLFYGIVTRSDSVLRYLNLGSSSAFYARGGGQFAALPSQGVALTKASGMPVVQQAEIQFFPEDRFALISDGFVDAAGGSRAVCEILDRHRGADAADALNEFVYAVKSKFADQDEMPMQDCTAIVFDVDAKLIKVVGKS